MPSLTDVCALATAAVPQPSVPRAANAVAAPASVRPLGDVAAHALQQALDAHAGNVSAAARALGVSRNTVYRYLRAQSCRS